MELINQVTGEVQDVFVEEFNAEDHRLHLSLLADTLAMQRRAINALQDTCSATGTGLLTDTERTVAFRLALCVLGLREGLLAHCVAGMATKKQ